MRRRTAIAVTVGVATVVVSRLVSIGGGEYVVRPIAGTVVHTLPTAFLTWTIATFGGYAETLFAFSAAGLAATLFALVSLLSVWIAARVRTEGPIEPIGTALGTALLAAALTGSLAHAIGLGFVGGAIAGLGGRFERSSIPAGTWSRRDTVTALGGSALAGFGTLLASTGADTTRPELSLSERTRREIEELRNAAAVRELDVPGLPGLLTPTEEFYVVDINIDPPIVDAEEWSVTIGGAVDTELELTRDRLDLFDPVSELRTLRCIAEELNGIRIGTAVWTGVPMTDLLDRVGPNGAYAKLTAADRYSAVFPLEMLEDARLVYAMNGRALTREHGFPARMIVPGSWGKINVKWLTGIEIITEEEDGFWSEWNGDSSVNTIAKLWRAQPTEEGMVLAGHAYAGDRGISAVEVSTDGGDTWAEATLSEPLPDSATWRQWRYEWRPERDAVEVVVRAIDGEGRLQTEEYSEPKPDGPTGWVSRRVETTEAKDFTRGYRR
jgi:DMSO/TMAO reductase YedYZ molybdopterin-dependent catalytic subunit